MKRTTVKIPDDLDARLRHEAERSGKTISEITREALDAHLGASAGGRRRLGGAAFRSGVGNLSERVEEILTKELGQRP